VPGYEPYPLYSVIPYSSSSNSSLIYLIFFSPIDSDVIRDGVFTVNGLNRTDVLSGPLKQELRTMYSTSFVAEPSRVYDVEFHGGGYANKTRFTT